MMNNCIKSVYSKIYILQSQKILYSTSKFEYREHSPETIYFLAGNNLTYVIIIYIMFNVTESSQFSITIENKC